MPNALPPTVTPEWLDALARVLRDAAARAAAFIAAHAGDRASLDWEHKGPADFVSLVDRGAVVFRWDVLMCEFQ